MTCSSYACTTTEPSASGNI